METTAYQHSPLPIRHMTLAWPTMPLVQRLCHAQWSASPTTKPRDPGSSPDPGILSKFFYLLLKQFRLYLYNNNNINIMQFSVKQSEKQVCQYVNYTLQLQRILN